MLPYVIVGLLGAVIAQRRGPRTKCKKLTCIGPRSGQTYQVEEFPDSGFIVVRLGTGVGTFQKNKGSPGYTLTAAKGSKKAIDHMVTDFCGPTVDSE